MAASSAPDRGIPIAACNGATRLAGSLWLPAGEPRGLVLMHPGSGPSDRDNDVLFPPIRSALLDVGVAVCSYDKRGVGASSGHWEEAGITEQASDLLAGLSAARAAVGDLPIGLFGHSQGGWVVLDAAGEAAAAFVIANSGPSVTPRQQETYSTERSLRSRGWDDEAVRIGMASFSATMDLLAHPFDVAQPTVEQLPMIDSLRAAGAFIPDSEELWSFAATVMGHDPGPALRGLEVPLLVVLGEEDDVVPVQRSTEVFRHAVRSDLLELRVLPGGDHRLQNGEDFVDGYLDAVVGFIVGQLTSARG